MTEPSYKVQQALCMALLNMLKSPDLTPEEGEWVQQFALRTIAEYNLLKSKKSKGNPEHTVAA